jgi:hypothetical protein
VGTEKVNINRAPVLTLWTAVVAERLGFQRQEALTLGRAVAGLNAQSKGRRLGIFTAGKEEAGEARKQPADEVFMIELLGRPVPTLNTPEGIRAAIKGKTIDPDSVERYLRSKFGDALPAVRQAMEDLAGSYPPAELAGSAFRLYERFRPAVPRGKEGWGAQGVLDLAKIRTLAGKEK